MTLDTAGRTQCWHEVGDPTHSSGPGLPGSGLGLQVACPCQLRKQSKAGHQVKFFPPSRAPQARVEEVPGHREKDDPRTGTNHGCPVSSWGGSHSDWQPTITTPRGPTPPDLIREHHPPTGRCVDKGGSCRVSQMKGRIQNLDRRRDHTGLGDHAICRPLLAPPHPTHHFLSSRQQSSGLGKHMACGQDPWEDHATPLRPGAPLSYPVWITSHHHRLFWASIIL